jgi:hypothetical protein
MYTAQGDFACNDDSNEDSNKDTIEHFKRTVPGGTPRGHNWEPVYSRWDHITPASHNTASRGRGAGSITSCHPTKKYNTRYGYWEIVYNC